jgi:hypothetical protein
VKTIRPWKGSALATVVGLLAMVALGWIAHERYLAEKPVAASTESFAVKTHPAITDQLVVVVVDGLREVVAFDEDIMPTFHSLAARGASGVHITPPMTLTTLAVLTMGTGTEPGVSRALKNFDAATYDDESALQVLNEAGVSIALLGDAAWTQLFGVHAKHTLSLPDHGFYHGGHGDLADTDRHVFEEALKTIHTSTSDGKPLYPLVIVHVIGTDKTAHKSGAHVKESDGSPSAYSRACAAIDQEIGRLVKSAAPTTTWMVLADHGVNKWGSHGGGEEDARRAPFAIAGAGIRPSETLEKPLSSVASEWTALLGVRPPRRARTSAQYAILTLTDAARDAHQRAHLRVRMAFADQALCSIEEGTALGSLRQRLDQDKPITSREITDGLKHIVNRCDALNDDRSWLRIAGVSLSMLLQFALLLFIGMCANIHRVWAHALIWTLGSWLLLRYTGQWDFRAVELLGELTHSWRGFAIRTCVLVGLAALVPIGRRLGLGQGDWPPRIHWVCWALVVLLLGQSVMVYPFGPLPQMYRAMVLLALSVIVIALLYTRNERWPRALFGLVAAIGFYVGASLLIGESKHRLADSAMSTWMADTVLCATVFLLAIHALRQDRAHAMKGTWAAIGMLVLSAVFVHRDGPPWLVRSMLCALPIVLVALWLCRPNTRSARNSLMAVGLLLYRALATDPQFLVLVLLALCVFVLSDLTSKASQWSTPLIAGLALVAHYTFFYQVGQSYSLSGVDMAVVFTATKDSINLVEGFALILLQHLGPWLVIIAATVYHRAHAGDKAGLRILALALPCCFLIQGWGAFGGFETQIDNFWFTSHALPLFLFATCNVVLVGLATTLALGLSNGPDSSPSDGESITP